MITIISIAAVYSLSVAVERLLRRHSHISLGGDLKKVCGYARVRSFGRFKFYSKYCNVLYRTKNAKIQSQVFLNFNRNNLTCPNIGTSKWVRESEAHILDSHRV